MLVYLLTCLLVFLLPFASLLASFLASFCFLACLIACFLAGLLIYLPASLLAFLLREGFKKIEYWKIPLSGGLKHWILPKDHFKTHLFLGGETLLSLDPGPKGVSNL